MSTRNLLERTGLALVAATLSLACSSKDDRLVQLTGSSTTQDSAGGCQDVDGDGFGSGCAKGFDCDDRDPALTNQCPEAQCASPDAGCPCTTEGATTECGKRVGQVGDYVSCVSGERECVDGVWGECSINDDAASYSMRAAKLGSYHTMGGGGPCDDVCDPRCTSLGAGDIGGDAETGGDGSSTLPPGENPNNGPNLCENLTEEALKTMIGMVMMLDSSGSMGFTIDTCAESHQEEDCDWRGRNCKWVTVCDRYLTQWDLVEQPLKDFTSGADISDMSVGLEFFPEGSGYCDAGRYRDLSVPIKVISPDAAGQAQRNALFNEIDAEPMGGGTPLLDAVVGGLDAVKDWLKVGPNPGFTADGRPKKGVLLLTTDGVPDGCGSNEQDKAALAISNAYSTDGIETFVIGMEGEDVDLTYLNKLASAGSGATRPTAYFIDATSTAGSDQLTAALNEIRKQIVSCEFGIPVPPVGVVDPNETKITISADGQTRTVDMLLPPEQCGNKDGAYFDPFTSQILLCNKSCTFAQADPDASIEIEYSCKGSCVSDTDPAKPGPIDLLVMMDRSGSMNGSPWQAVVQATSDFADASKDTDTGLGLAYFPIADQCGKCKHCWLDGACKLLNICEPVCIGEETSVYDNCSFFKIRDRYCDAMWEESNYLVGANDTCTSSAYTDFNLLSNVAIADVDSAQIQKIRSSLSNVLPQYQGSTPTTPALQGAIDHIKGRQTNFPGRGAAVVLATDGQPNECGSVSNVETVAANGRAAGVDTFVIGIGNTGNLNTIAQAGAGRNAFQTGAGNTAEFLAAMQEVRKLVQSCTFEIPDAAIGTLVLDETGVYITNQQGVTTLLTQVDKESKCGAEPAWYLSDDEAFIKMCPSGCTLARAAQGVVNVLYQCLMPADEATATFTYDSEGVCDDESTPVWGDWSWSAKTPNGSWIDFEVATAEKHPNVKKLTDADFHSLIFTGDRFKDAVACASEAKVCNVNLTTGTQTGGPAGDPNNPRPRDVFIDEVLRQAGLSRHDRYVVVRATLHPSAEGAAPQLLTHELRATCEFSQ